MERKWRPQKYFNCKDSLGWCSGIDTREIPYQSIQSERVEFHCATRSLDPQRTAAGGRSRNGGASTTATTSSRHRTIHLSTTCLASIICVECVHGHSHSAIARRAKQKGPPRGGGGTHKRHSTVSRAVVKWRHKSNFAPFPAWPRKRTWSSRVRDAAEPKSGTTPRISRHFPDWRHSSVDKYQSEVQVVV